MTKIGSKAIKSATIYQENVKILFSENSTLKIYFSPGTGLTGIYKVTSISISDINGNTHLNNSPNSNFIYMNQVNPITSTPNTVFNIIGCYNNGSISSLFNIAITGSQTETNIYSGNYGNINYSGVFTGNSFNNSNSIELYNIPPQLASSIYKYYIN